MELFDFAPVGYVVLDPVGQVLSLNFAAARMLSGVRGHILGARLGSYVAEGQRPDFNGCLARALSYFTAERKSESCELTLVADRETREARLTMTAIEAAEPSVLVAIEDITIRPA